MPKSLRGFTLIEVLLVIGLIAILAAIVIIAINPGRQFAMARNAQRSSDVNAILNAVHQNMIDNRGNWTCVNGSIPTSSATNMDSTSGFDICDCLVDVYLPKMPFDPSTGNYTDCTDYDTGYTIIQSTSTSGRITIGASAEIGATISVTR